MHLKLFLQKSNPIIITKGERNFMHVSSNLFMIIVKSLVRIQQCVILVVMKKKVTVEAEITRVDGGPLIIHSHLSGMVYLTD